jgi:predicted nicotinamide N-methyase
MIADREAFIKTHTRLLPVPHAPEISLYVADEATALWQKTEDDLGAIGLPPPFWAFAWAGGQALARFILDHPEAVQGRSVLDFASGSGLVAIAAAKAGAASVTAVDIDGFAIAAIGLNAAVNHVRVTARQSDLVGSDEGWDAVLAGDICYERDLAERVVSWLNAHTAALRSSVDRSPMALKLAFSQALAVLRPASLSFRKKSHSALRREAAS